MVSISANATLLDKSGKLKQAAANGNITFGAVVEFLTKDVVARHLLLADRDFFPLFSAASHKTPP